MIVKSTISPLWFARPDQLAGTVARLGSIFAAAPQGTGIFFRADDIGVPGANLRAMLDCFRKHQVPLLLAVTPAWITESRWATLREWAGNDPLWGWHQHGWRHVNHQMSGRKGEFGTDRSRAAKKADILKGRARLQSIMGDAFRPIFTPPWNRFDAETGEVLAESGYAAVSRSSGEMKKVPLPEGLPDIPINVDLHTRSETDSAEGLDALLTEFEQAVLAGRIGVMLHHQRMNGAALEFLDALVGMAACSLERVRF